MVSVGGSQVPVPKVVLERKGWGRFPCSKKLNGIENLDKP